MSMLIDKYTGHPVTTGTHEITSVILLVATKGMNKNGFISRDVEIYSYQKNAKKFLISKKVSFDFRGIIRNDVKNENQYLTDICINWSKGFLFSNVQIKDGNYQVNDKVEKEDAQFFSRQRSVESSFDMLSSFVDLQNQDENSDKSFKLLVPKVIELSNENGEEGEFLSIETSCFFKICLSKFRKNFLKDEEETKNIMYAAFNQFTVSNAMIFQLKILHSNSKQIEAEMKQLAYDQLGLGNDCDQSGLALYAEQLITEQFKDDPNLASRIQVCKNSIKLYYTYFYQVANKVIKMKITKGVPELTVIKGQPIKINNNYKNEVELQQLEETL